MSAATHRPEIVGERRNFGALGGGAGFYHGIGDKARAGFFRLRQAEFRGRDRHHAERREEFPHLGELSRIMGREDELSFKLAPHQPIALFCSSTSFAIPDLASASKACSWASENTAASAVAWTSTRDPAPVMTKFASVSAEKSSS